jgi:hypothetical protein
MANATTGPVASAGAKMLYLIKRRPTTSRDELIAHWFANHMPAVIAGQEAQREAGRLHAKRYLATLFNPNSHGANPWDGMAQLWFDAAPPAPAEAHGTVPADSFQERAEPYVPWPTTEYVVMDPTPDLDLSPLTLNAPFPCTRSGFHKVSFLVATKPDADHDSFFEHWLDVHVENVGSVMKQVGGFGYIVSQSINPSTEPYAGLAELYFHDEAAWAEFQHTIKPDGMERWTDPAATLILRSGTELIGIA